MLVVLTRKFRIDRQEDLFAVGRELDGVLDAFATIIPTLAFLTN